MKLSAKVGYQNITREQVAKEAGVGAGTVNLHYSSMKQLKKEIVRHAVRSDNIKVIAQAIVANEPYVKRKLSVGQRKHIMATSVV